MIRYSSNRIKEAETNLRTSGSASTVNAEDVLESLENPTMDYSSKIRVVKRQFKENQEKLRETVYGNGVKARIYGFLEDMGWTNMQKHLGKRKNISQEKLAELLRLQSSLNDKYKSDGRQYLDASTKLRVLRDEFNLHTKLYNVANAELEDLRFKIKDLQDKKSLKQTQRIAAQREKNTDLVHETLREVESINSEIQNLEAEGSAIRVDSLQIEGYLGRLNGHINHLINQGQFSRDQTKVTQARLRNVTDALNEVRGIVQDMELVSNQDHSMLSELENLAESSELVEREGKVVDEIKQIHKGSSEEILKAGKLISRRNSTSHDLGEVTEDVYKRTIEESTAETEKRLDEYYSKSLI